jgi:hypothetical protein
MRNLIAIGFGLVIAVFSSQPAYADPGQNLKGLDDVLVTITQSTAAPVISANEALQLETDTKLKLKSAGITLTASQDATKAVFDIDMRSVKEITNEWVLVQILVSEDVNTSSRKKSQKTTAFTYVDQRLFKMSMGAADKTVYNTALNDLVTKFVAQYLDQNSK